GPGPDRPLTPHRRRVVPTTAERVEVSPRRRRGQAGMARTSRAPGGRPTLMNTRRTWPLVAACAAVVLAGVGSPAPVASAGATEQATLAATTADPFDIVYDVESDNAKTVHAGQHQLSRDAYRRV